ncbi:MAG: hypothetical protein ABIP94_03315 [Planctomycetota bacterium]
MRTPNLGIRIVWPLNALAPSVAAQDRALPAVARSAAFVAPQGGAPNYAYIVKQSGNNDSVINTDFNAVVAIVPAGARPSAPRRLLHAVNAISREKKVGSTRTKEDGA